MAEYKHLVSRYGVYNPSHEVHDWPGQDIDGPTKSHLVEEHCIPLRYLFLSAIDLS